MQTENEARRDLAACYRLFDWLGWTELIFNHITVRLPARSGKQAEYLINKDRHKPVQLLVDYFFTEADSLAHKHLAMVLREAGYGDRIGNGIYLEHARFQDKADAIIQHVSGQAADPEVVAKAVSQTGV